MKTVFLTLIFALTTTPSFAEPTRSFSIDIHSTSEPTPARARLTYLDACSAQRANLTRSPVAPFLKTATCSSPTVHDRTTAFRATGRLFVELKRSLDVSMSELATGYTDSLDEARKLWNLLCTDWQAELADPSSRKRVLLETCGVAEADTFYVRPEITSTALRIIRTRLADNRGELCQCRSREVVFYQDSPFGPIKRVRTEWDLMALVEAGYYEKQSTFQSQVECNDESARSALCTE